MGCKKWALVRLGFDILFNPEVIINWISISVTKYRAKIIIYCLKTFNGVYLISNYIPIIHLSPVSSGSWYVCL